MIQQTEGTRMRFGSPWKSRAMSQWFVPKTLGRLMLLVALSALGLGSLAHQSRVSGVMAAPRPRLAKPAQLPLRYIREVPPRISPADRFIKVAPEEIDERFVIAAPEGIDDHMIVAPERLTRHEGTVPRLRQPVPPAPGGSR
jgi:hypothetical protein